MQLREIRVKGEAIDKSDTSVWFFTDIYSLDLIASSDRIAPTEAYTGSMSLVLDRSVDTLDDTVFDPFQARCEGNVSFTINYGHLYYNLNPESIPEISQTNPFHGCWAVNFAVLLAWRDNRSYTINQLLNMAGPEYQRAFHGIATAEQLEHFAHIFGLQTEPAKSYTLATPASEFRLLMEEYGPLYLTNNPHMKIMTGISEGDTSENSWVYLFDSLVGTIERSSYNEFIRWFSEGAPTDPRIIHCLKSDISDKVPESFLMGRGEASFIPINDYPGIAHCKGTTPRGGSHEAGPESVSITYFIQSIIVEIFDEKVKVKIYLIHSNCLEFEGCWKKITF